MKVTVGVFWLCNFDIIGDKEEYEITENMKSIIDYSRQHKDVWDTLSATQCNGYYSKYSFDFFYRGRVAYDCEAKTHLIELNSLSNNLSIDVKEKIKKFFKIQ